MNIRELTRAELKTVYDTEMVHTFPPAELKPFAAMEQLLDKGRYRPLGLFEEDGTLVSYLLLWTDSSGRYALGDYLGTIASRRNGGLGAKLLHMVFESFPEFKCILGEAEVPDSGDLEADALRRRRLAFYERNGLRYLNYDCALFGVHYRCLVYGEIGDEEAIEAHRRIYAEQFSPKQMERFIQIPLRPGEAVKPATAWAEE